MLVQRGMLEVGVFARYGYRPPIESPPELHDGFPEPCRALVIAGMTGAWISRVELECSGFVILA